MRPAQQGAFDGLCGVYALINALDLVGLKQRRGRLHAALFQQLTHALGAVAVLSAMHDGLTPGDLVAAADVAFSWLERAHGVHLTLSQPYADVAFGSMRRFTMELRKHCRTPDSAAVISFKAPGYAHWTVPAAVAGTRMTLRDSNGRAELDLADYALSGGRYQLRAADTLVLTRR